MATSSGNRGRGTRTIKIKVEALVRVITYTYVSYIKMEALRATLTRFTKIETTKCPWTRSNMSADRNGDGGHAIVGIKSGPCDMANSG